MVCIAYKYVQLFCHVFCHVICTCAQSSRQWENLLPVVVLKKTALVMHINRTDLT